MNIRILAAATLILASAGAASAQPYQDPGLPPPATPIAPPPAGTLSTTHEVHAADVYGNRVDKTESTYRNSNGVAQDSSTTTPTVPAPPPPPVTSSTTTSTATTTTAPQ